MILLALFNCSVALVVLSRCRIFCVCQLHHFNKRVNEMNIRSKCRSPRYRLVFALFLFYVVCLVCICCCFGAVDVFFL